MSVECGLAKKSNNNVFVCVLELLIRRSEPTSDVLSLYQYISDFVRKLTAGQKKSKLIAHPKCLFHRMVCEGNCFHSSKHKFLGSEFLVARTPLFRGSCDFVG